MSDMRHEGNAFVAEHSVFSCRTQGSLLEIVCGGRSAANLEAAVRRPAVRRLGRAVRLGQLAVVHQLPPTLTCKVDGVVLGSALLCRRVLSMSRMGHLS